MLLKRCPSCRGFSDAEESPRCTGCGADLPPMSPRASETLARALREGQADRRKSSVLLGILAVLGGLGLGGISGGILLIPLSMYFVWASSNERIRRSGGHRVLIKFLAVLGALVGLGIGAIILVFIVCLASVATR
ncbi:MAG TPA: hypothetical protein VEN81_00780 [Planctomycetota bacterium]|nr:hypothetical protein [Planctomycetota bacterium]